MIRSSMKFCQTELSHFINRRSIPSQTSGDTRPFLHLIQNEWKNHQNKQLKHEFTSNKSAAWLHENSISDKVCLVPLRTHKPQTRNQSVQTNDVPTLHDVHTLLNMLINNKQHQIDIIVTNKDTNGQTKISIKSLIDNIERGGGDVLTVLSTLTTQTTPFVTCHHANIQTDNHIKSIKSQTINPKLIHAGIQAVPAMKDSSLQIKPKLKDSNIQVKPFVKDATHQIKPVQKDANVQIRPPKSKDATCQVESNYEEFGTQTNTKTKDTSCQVNSFFKDSSSQTKPSLLDSSNQTVPDITLSYVPVNQIAIKETMDEASVQTNSAVKESFPYFDNKSENETLKINGNETLKINGNEILKINGNETLKIYGNETLKVYGNETLTVYGNETLKVYGNETLAINGDINFKVKGHETVKMDGHVTLGVNGNETLKVKVRDNWNDNNILKVNEMQLRNSMNIKC